MDSRSAVQLRSLTLLQHRLLAYHSGCSLTALPQPVTDSRVVSEARGSDLIVSAVDNDTPRLAAALLANRFLKVHVDVGTGVTEDEQGQRLLAGDARLLIPGQGQGCVVCVGGLSSESEARHELFAPPGSLKRGQQTDWREQRLGSLITINSLTVAVGVQLWLDLLGGRLRTSHWWVEGRGVEADYAAVAGAEDCRICQ